MVFTKKVADSLWYIVSRRPYSIVFRGRVDG